MGRIFGFVWREFTGVPDDVAYFIRNVHDEPGCSSP